VRNTSDGDCTVIPNHHAWRKACSLIFLNESLHLLCTLADGPGRARSVQSLPGAGRRDRQDLRQWIRQLLCEHADYSRRVYETLP
jgi:hypothetical protein